MPDEVPFIDLLRSAVKSGNWILGIPAEDGKLDVYEIVPELAAQISELIDKVEKEHADD